MSNILRRSIGAAALVLLLSGSALAQPGPRDTPPPQREPGDDAPPRGGDPERAKKWVEHMLKETHRREERLKEALQRLEKGDAPGQILREFAAERATSAGGPEHGKPEGRPPRGDGSPGDAPDMPGRDAGPPAGGPSGGPGGRSSPSDKEEIREFVKQNMPGLAKRLEERDRGGPEGRDRVMERLAPRIMDAIAAKRRDPELFEVRVKEIQAGLNVFDGIRALREASRGEESPERSAKIDRVTKQLRESLASAVEARDAVRAREIDLLAKRLEKMRADLDRDQSEREKKVDEELARIQKKGPPGPPQDDRPGR